MDNQHPGIPAGAGQLIHPLDKGRALRSGQGASLNEAPLHVHVDEGGLPREKRKVGQRSASNLLEAILEPAIVGVDDGRDLFDRPEIAEIRECEDQRAQLRLLARFSRGILERTYIPHGILRSAASSDPNAAELQRRDAKRRGDGQRVYIDMLMANGPLRGGLTAEDAAATYSVLSNPSTYALLVGERGWTADRFEHWLGDSLTALLLPAQLE